MTLSSRLLPLANVLPRWVGRLLLLVLCWQCAGLFWTVFAPSTSHVDLVMPQSGGGLASVGKEALLAWYGSENKASVDSSGDYQLIAVIAGPDGAAIFKDGGGKHLAIRSGEEIVGGLRLLAVEPEQVLVEHNGVKRTLSLAQRAKAIDIKVTERKVPGASSAAIRLTRGQMLSMIQGDNIAHWDKGFSALPEGGIRVENADSHPLSKMLKLRNGDILKRVNQQALDNLADISLLLHAIGQHARIDLVLVRNGNSLTQHYDIKP